MQWTKEQMRACFSSPVYVGGGGCAKRLKTRLNKSVWHDAAYWVPLFFAYLVVAREEACGIECDDFVFDVATPYVIIRNNMTRSLDGVTPGGVKRRARGRIIPLHPELLCLNIRGYVDAIKAEGHVMPFPELYQHELKKRGGTRFYASAGRYVLDYVDCITPLLRTSSGKRAHLHSMRTTGGSAFELSNAKQLEVDDITGHARAGTGPIKYSKAKIVALDELLFKRLTLLVDALSNVTERLQPAAIRLLPLTERSRTGSASGCASRKLK